MGKARNLARLVVDSGGAVDASNLTNAVPADGSISTAKIADSAITTGKISDGAVGTADIAANAVTAAKLAREGTTGQVLTSNGAGSDPSYQTISTTPTTAQVLTATAGASAGAVGTYIFAGPSGNAGASYGSTLAGSSLRPAGIGAVSTSYINWGSNRTGGVGLVSGNGTALSGTWRCMGQSSNYSYSDPYNTYYTNAATLWLRIS